MGSLSLCDLLAPYTKHQSSSLNPRTATSMGPIHPKGPYTAHLRTLAPKTIPGMIFGTSVLDWAVNGPLGTGVWGSLGGTVGARKPKAPCSFVWYVHGPLKRWLHHHDGAYAYAMRLHGALGKWRGYAGRCTQQFKRPGSTQSLDPKTDYRALSQQKLAQAIRT